MLRRVVVALMAVAVSGLFLVAPAAGAEDRPPWAEAPDPSELRERLLATADEPVAADDAGSSTTKSSQPCWSKSYRDVAGDGDGMDIVSYALAFDCDRNRFELSLTTKKAVPADWLVVVGLILDTDGEWDTDCAGQYSVVGMSDPEFSMIDGAVSAATPDCLSEVERGSANFRVSDDRRTFRLSFRHSQIDWAPSFEWGVMNMAFGAGEDDFGMDFVPDSPQPHVARNFAPAFEGYWVAGGNGTVRAVGEAKHYGDVSHVPLSTPIVDMAALPNHSGYWLLSADGGIFTFGAARFYGSAGAWNLTQPAVAMAPTPSGRGYWVATADGGVFGFGDAPFLGSMGGRALNKPIVGMASTPTGKGYWLVASDGGIFSFGDAAFHGSTGAMTLDGPIVGMAASQNGKGYWLVASDGGIFAFGGAKFYGSTGGMALVSPIVGMTVSPNGGGYRFVAGDGGIFAFGDASFLGSMATQPLGAPVTAMAG